MEKIILIATSNEGKVREMEKAFAGLPVRLVPLSRIHEILPDASEIKEPVEDGATFMENACIKARCYREQTGLAALADDSGLAVEALGGAPVAHDLAHALDGVGDVLGEVRPRRRAGSGGLQGGGESQTGHDEQLERHEGEYGQGHQPGHLETDDREHHERGDDGGDRRGEGVGEEDLDAVHVLGGSRQ